MLIILFGQVYSCIFSQFNYTGYGKVCSLGLESQKSRNLPSRKAMEGHLGPTHDSRLPNSITFSYQQKLPTD